ncbi:hypothetical protein GGR56DRAFT_511082 [Xylariaceae sp. FL0804]|nr:hypothetical protein GGR56DRAFT_511082 [Xylariaceae sp. FL0804]
MRSACRVALLLRPTTLPSFGTSAPAPIPGGTTDDIETTRVSGLARWEPPTEIQSMAVKDPVDGRQAQGHRRSGVIVGIYNDIGNVAALRLRLRRAGVVLAPAAFP